MEFNDTDGLTIDYVTFDKDDEAGKEVEKSEERAQRGQEGQAKDGGNKGNKTD